MRTLRYLTFFVLIALIFVLPCEGSLLKVTGGAYFFPENIIYRASFSMEVTGPPSSGNWFKYYYTRTRMNFVSTTIDSATFSGNTVIFSGTGTVNGVEGYTFTAEATDAKPDIFKIVIKKSDDSLFYSAGPKSIAGGDLVFTRPSNSPPSFERLTDLTIDEGKTLEVTLFATDPDGDLLTYSALGLPAGASFTPSTRSFRWTPNYDQAGIYPVTFTVTDPQGLSDSMQVNVTVKNVNRLPKIISSPITSASENQLYNYPVQAEDPDQDPLTFGLTKAPSGMNLHPTTGLISWTPSAIHVGLHEITVQVSDGKGGTDTQTFSLNVVATADRTPPVVNLIAPSQVQALGILNVEANAIDNIGVKRVSFYIDGLFIKDFDSAPYRITYNVPDEVGKIISVRVVARDEAGNQGEATASVTIVDTPDTTPPIIKSVSLPPSAAPGETITILTEVTDDRGVAEVRFTYRGTALGTDTLPPYEGKFTLPQDATPGETLWIDIEALDTSGNKATAQGSLSVTQVKDTTPPTAVTLQAPAEALPGQTIQLNASAVDNVGILKILFFADGLQFGEDPQSPYQINYKIPESQEVGSQVVFLAKAIDFSENQTDSPPASTKIVAPGEGLIAGEVYDDTTGLPLTNVSVRLTSMSGKALDQPQETTTDEQGRFWFFAKEGMASLEIKKQGYTSSYREEPVQAGIINNFLDVRITPLGSGNTINPLTGGNILIDENQIGLYVPPGAFSESLSISLNKLSEQGLPSPLPLGWTPVTAIHVGPENKTPNSPLELSIRGSKNLGGSLSSALTNLIAVFWDTNLRKWRRVESSSLSGEEGLSILMSGTGTVALIRPDTQPASPAVPDIGNGLTGVSPQAIPEGIGADVLRNPEIIFMQAGIRSNVQVKVNPPQPLPSGTRIRVDFNEFYERMDNLYLMPEPMSQDIILYQSAGGLEGKFVVSPSQVFDPFLLKEGSIDLAVHRPTDAMGSGIIGTSGGTVVSPDGFSINIPPGAVTQSTPISLRALTDADPVLSGDSRFELLKGVEIDLGGSTLSIGASLALNLKSPLPSGAQVLVVRNALVEGVSRYEFFGIATINGNTITLSPNALGLPLPGIREEGRYYFIKMTAPVGYVTGSVSIGGSPVTNGLVSEDRLPFVSLTKPGKPLYALASPLGSNSIFGRDLTSGSNATGNALLDSQNQIATLDLSLVSSRPTIVSITPNHGATGINQATTVVVKFSSPMDLSTINFSSFSMRRDTTEVQGIISLLPDNMTAVLQPATLLADNSLYTIRLSTAVKDSFGQPLLGNQPDGSFVSTFRTVDITPPKRPEPGQITMTMPDSSGIVIIRGSIGAVESNTFVTAINQSTRAATTVTAGNDGSFEVRITASIFDKIELLLKDQTGNQTKFSPGLFDNGDGNAVVGSEGGIVRLSDGSSFIFAFGSFEEPTQIKIQRLDESQIPIPIPIEYNFEFAAAFSLDTGDKDLLQPLKFNISANQVYPEDTKFFICKVENLGEEKRLVLLDLAGYKDGFIELKSWGGLIGMFSHASPILALRLLPQPVTFVVGNVYKVPPIGGLTINVQSKVMAQDLVAVSVIANPIAPGVTVSDVKLYIQTSFPPTMIWEPISDYTAGSGSIIYKGIIHPDSIQETTSYQWQEQPVTKKLVRWKAKAKFTKPDGKTFEVEALVANEIVTDPSLRDEKLRQGVGNVFDWVGGGARPAVGAWVEINNGLDISYPTITRTNSSGSFILACRPGPNHLRVFDPLTGAGMIIPFEAPATLFEYTKIPRIVVPEGFGDTKPPTLDIQVSGDLVRGHPMTITITANDDEGIAWVRSSILGQELFNQPNSGRFNYFPTHVGDLEIKAIAFDIAGNWTTRTALVFIKDIDWGTTDTNIGNNISLQPDSTNIDLNLPVYVQLANAVPDGKDLRGIKGVGVHFEDSSGNRIEAVGGTACGGTYLRVRPSQPLPPNTNMRLVVDAGTGGGSGGGSGGALNIAFTTQGFNIGGIIGGFKEIRGITIVGNYAYVADYGDETKGVKIVDIANPSQPVLVGSFPFIRARGIASDLNSLVVVGGGGSDDVLPVLRYYTLENPRNPTKVGSVILFPIGSQAIPINVRLSGSLAYVSVLGLGVQTISLDKIREIAAIPFNERTPEFRTGSPAIISGFRLPNDEHDPPLTSYSYDVALGLKGLAVTGGLENQLFVLSSGEGGFLGLIPQTNGLPYFNVPLGIQRLSAVSDFLIRKDLNNDGVIDYQNINLVAVSHGSGGISFVDVSNPSEARLLSTINTGSRVLDMEIVDGILFTGDRIVTIYDPTSPIVSGKLTFKKPDGSIYEFSAGGDLAITTHIPLGGTERIVAVASSDASRNNLQVGQINLPLPGPDWDIIRTLPPEPHINPDNLDYLNTGDPINPFTGEYVTSETDLAVPGRGLSFAFTRTYRSQNEFNGVIGFGWDHNYNSRLTVLPGQRGYPDQGDIIWYDGSGKADKFILLLSDPNTPSYKAPRGVFAELKKDEDNFKLVESDGKTYTYRPSNKAPFSRYLLKTIEDRFGNIMRLTHNNQDQLEQVTDTMGRVFNFSYNSRGRLTAVSDFKDRTVTYRYDYDDNLISVTDPSGKETKYTYTCGFLEFGNKGEGLPTKALNHNLRTITDPKGQTYLEIHYTDNDPTDINFDRVESQRLGVPPDGGVYHYQYYGSGGIVSSATTRNASGHSTTRVYNDKGNLERITELATVAGTIQNVTTYFQYNDDGLVKSVISPSGLETKFTYNENASSRLRQGDLLSQEIFPIGGGPTRKYEYRRGDWGTPVLIKDPAGFETHYKLDVSGKGLIEEVHYPLVTLSDGSKQQIIETYNYGNKGEILSITKGDGVVIRFEYKNTSTGPGYLQAIVVDSEIGGMGFPPRTVDGNPLNLRTSYTFDDVGNLRTITDPRGKVTYQDVNTLNQVIRIYDGRGERRFEYDGNNSLSKIFELGGLVIEYGYNSLGRVIQKTEKIPNHERTTAYGYDGSERPILVRTPLGHEIITEFDPRSLPLAVSTRGGPNPVIGQMKSFTYDKDGNMTRLADGQDHGVSYIYNEFGELKSKIDPNGYRTEYEYDRRGNIVANRIYDNNGQLVSEQTFELDELGRMRVIRETIIGGLTPEGGGPQTFETRIQYDAAHRIICTTDSLGRIQSRKFDGLDRVVQETDKAGNQYRMVYQGLDLIESIESELEPDGNFTHTATRYNYDIYGRIVEKIHAPDSPDERRQKFSFDSRDNLIKEENVGGVITFMEYDGYNRLIKIKTGVDEINLEYDLEDRLIRQYDALGRSIEKEYDGRNRLIRTRYADGTSSEATFYSDDSVQTFTDRAGNVFTYQYDDSNRITEVLIKQADGFEGVTGRAFSYDPLDRVIVATSNAPGANYTNRFLYNSNGNVLKHIQGIYQVIGNYNIAGERLRLQYPSSLQLDMAYDSLSRYKQLTTGGNLLAQYDYSGSKRYSSTRFGNNTRSTLGYNAAREEKTRLYFSPNRSVQTGFQFGYDAAGRLRGVVYPHLANKGDAYTYTNEGWLASARYGLERPLDSDADTQMAEHTSLYSFDRAGNRESVIQNGFVLNYSSNDLNQYTSIGNQALQYDLNGNLRSDGQRTFIYDAFNQLVKVIDTATNTELVRYEYDAFGQRIKKITSAGVENYIYDGNQIIAIENDSGQLLREYIYGSMVSRPVLMRRQGMDYYYQYDQRGSVVAITDYSGEIIERYVYDAYGVMSIFDGNGNSREKSQIDNDFTFSAAIWEPLTGLLHMDARDYDPHLGRFLQADPSGTVDGLNLYAYTGNDPINYNDPTGLYRHAVAENIQTGSFADLSDVTFGLIGEMSIITGATYAEMITGVVSMVGSGAMRMAKGLSKTETAQALGRIAKKPLKQLSHDFKEWGLNRFPTGVMSLSKQKTIQAIARARGIEIGVRATKPWTAAGARIFEKIGIPVKPLSVQDKTCLGIVGKFYKGRYRHFRSDSDIAWVRDTKTGRMWSNNEVRRLGVELNEIFKRTGRMGEFSHGAHFTALETKGMTIEKYIKMGHPGPVQVFGHSGGPHMMNAYGVKNVAQQNRVFWPSQWDKPAPNLPYRMSQGDPSPDRWDLEITDLFPKVHTFGVTYNFFAGH